MGKKTKQEALMEYIEDLNGVFKKILNNSAKVQDYIFLEKYYIMVGVSQEYIDNIYLDCGFEGSSDFYLQRQRLRHHQIGNVGRTLSKIKGTTEAIIETLQYKLASMNTTIQAA